MPEHYDVTLSQFSAQIDEHLGHEAGFASTVIELYGIRARIAAAKERREKAYRELEARFSRQPVAALEVPCPGRARQVIRRSAITTKYRRAVSSGAAKKANKDAWLRARALKPWCCVKASQTVAEAVGGGLPKLPPIPHRHMDTGSVLNLYQSPAWAVLGQLADEETAAKDALAKIAAGCGWDGTEAVFEDGWAVSLNALRYDSDKLKVIEPKLWEDLAVVTSQSYGGMLQITDYDTALEKGWLDENEIDEIDGD